MNRFYTKTLLFACLTLASVQIFPQTGGRIAVVADGNYRDPDDICATPVSLALLHALNLDDNLVHYSHSCDLQKGGSDPGGDYREVEMQKSCDGTADLWGDFKYVPKFYNCKKEQDSTVANLAKAIDKAHSDGVKLTIVLAGETDIPYYAMKKASSAALANVHILSHHTANESGDYFDYSDIKALSGYNSANFKRISNQNDNLKKELSEWYWAGEHKDDRIKWLWERGYEAQEDYMDYKNIRGDFDCSDAGMVWYWATGDSYGTVSELKEKLLEFVGDKDTIRPALLFDFPEDGTEMSAPANLHVKVLAMDAQSGLKDVKLYLNDALISTKTSVPFEWGASNSSDTKLFDLPTGRYTLRVEATDNTGNISTRVSEVTIGTVIDATGMNFSTDTINVSIGNSLSLSPDFEPSNTSNQHVDYFSRNTSIAEVNEEGTITGLSIGSTIISAKAYDGGFKDSVYVNIVAAVGIHNETFEKFTVYPNPIQDHLKIRFHGYTGANIRLINNIGKTVLFQTEVKPYQPIPIYGIRPGIYILEIKNENYIETKVIIIQ